MNSLATHMRMTGLSVSNEDVDSRMAAIKALKTSWTKINKPDAIISKAAEVSAALGGDGIPPEALGKEVEAAVQKKASAFLYADRPLDVGIVAGMVSIEMVSAVPDTSGWLIADLWAAALWLALSFQPPLGDPKRELLRASVLEAARNRSVAGSDAARQRVQIPDFGEVSLVAGNEGKLGDSVKAAAEPTISALRRNAALDREEIDFLWWAQLRRSRLLKRPLDSIDEVARVVSAGLEGAAYLRRMPSEVHREIVLRTISANPSVGLAGVLKSLGTDRELLAQVYVGKVPASWAAVFPLITAIVTGNADFCNSSTIERDAEEWGSRALLEASLLKVQASGPSKL